MEIFFTISSLNTTLTILSTVKMSKVLCLFYQNSLLCVNTGLDDGNSSKEKTDWISKFVQIIAADAVTVDTGDTANLDLDMGGSNTFMFSLYNVDYRGLLAFLTVCGLLYQRALYVISCDFPLKKYMPTIGTHDLIQFPEVRMIISSNLCFFEICKFNNILSEQNRKLTFLCYKLKIVFNLDLCNQSIIVIKRINKA